MPIDPDAGKPADPAKLIDIAAVTAAYYNRHPDPRVPAQRVIFGTSGHRGASLTTTFTEWHILAITQAICLYRRLHGIDGPLFLGFDTHALSRPAFETALEVLAANGVDVLIAAGDEFTPTPAVSHAIVTYNRRRESGFADGIIVTPSHNPPEDGGFKYNPPHGGPAETAVTTWIESKANDLLADIAQVKRVPYAKALQAPQIRRHDFLGNYVADLGNVVAMEAIRTAGLRLGVDALGGAGLHYWRAIADHYQLDLDVRHAAADPTFGFMTLDWDGRIRMDPSSPYAMRSLIDLKDKYDLAFACDTDHDRHGIVTKSTGLLPPNHYLAVCVDYLFAHRPAWQQTSAVGKTVVSSGMIDRVAARQQKKVHTVPVGFKWFVPGLVDHALGFAGEESAGSTFLRIDGEVWTTDKDGIIAALLAAEITATMQRDPGELYQSLEGELGKYWYRRSDAPATAAQRQALLNLDPEKLDIPALAGEKVERIINRANDGNLIGGIKVVTPSGWFAARPSGTEDIYKIYAESAIGEAHLSQLEHEAALIVAQVFAT
jgi:phosphoglucomutase